MSSPFKSSLSFSLLPAARADASNISAASKYSPRLNAAIASSIDGGGDWSLTEKLQRLFFLDRAILGLAQRLRLARAVALVELEQARLMRPHLAQRALLPFVERLVAVAHSILAALRLQEDRDLRQHVFDFRAHHRDHPPDFPLRAHAQPQIADVQHLGEIYHHVKVRRRRVGQHEARILGWDSRFQRFGVELRGLRQQIREFVLESR